MIGADVTSPAKGRVFARVTSVNHARLPSNRCSLKGFDVRVMGVDPGLTRCGLSVIESGKGRQVIALDVDVVRTPSDARCTSAC